MRGLPMFVLGVVAASGLGLATAAVTKAAVDDKPKIPIVVGAWTGTSESVVIGTRAHHPGTDTEEGKPRLREVTFTLNVEGQDGRRFWGTLKSAEHSERFAALFSSSHVFGYGADPDWFYHFRSHGPDRLEVCYTQPVAGCTVFTRAQP